MRGGVVHRVARAGRGSARTVGAGRRGPVLDDSLRERALANGLRLYGRSARPPSWPDALDSLPVFTVSRSAMSTFL
jgi:hypothetical protein